MFDKNMFRPKSKTTTTTTTTTPFQSFTHKTTTATRSIWVIVQLCFVVIQILASLVSPVNCDKPITTSSLSSSSSSSSPSLPSSSSSSSSGLHFIRSHNGDKLLHRVTRLTKLDQYALLDHNNSSSNSASHDRLSNSANYMASYGLRTRFQPQKFYSKKERTSTLGAPKGNLVSLNLISEPPKDICNGFCNCERKNAFVTVTCDYQKNSRVSVTRENEIY